MADQNTPPKKECDYKNRHNANKVCIPRKPAQYLLKLSIRKMQNYL